MTDPCIICGCDIGRVGIKAASVGMAPSGLIHEECLFRDVNERPAPSPEDFRAWEEQVRGENADG